MAGTPVERFDKALAIAAEMVEGLRTCVSAEDADDVHEPLVWRALLGRARSDPVLAAKLRGPQGRWTWLDGDEGTPLSEGEARAAFAALPGPAEGEWDGGTRDADAAAVGAAAARGDGGGGGVGADV